MTTVWNTEMVLALAPDPASAKAGRGLASPPKWSGLGTSEGLIWGECQGSGANPYQAKVDPSGPAFSCSCPSRKFPCKHAIGLMLVWASSSSSFAEAAPPAWVVSWKENRDKRAEKAREKVDRGEPTVDLAARARREASREAKIASGLDDLALWLSDLVRQGFNTLGARPGNIWDEQARRMIDAQAPGVARRLRQIDEMSLAGDRWQVELIDRLGRLHLLVEAFKRRADATPEVAADVRAAIGFPTDLDLVRGGDGVRDHWQVIGQAVAVEDRLTVQRTWLVGRTTNRPALVLDFGAGGRPVETTISPGTDLDAELAFFPGAAPLRALVKERFAPPEPLVALAGGTTIAEAFAAYGHALSKTPWLELYPVVLDGVSVEQSDGAWSVRDASGATAPLVKKFGGGWHLLALGGGGPLTISGEFDGAALDPLGCQVDGRFIALARREADPAESISIARSVAVPLLVEAAASALVGVDRRPPPAPSGEDAIGRAVAGLESREPASRLLAIAAAASLYGRVGRTPARDASPPSQPCPPDDRPECLPAQAVRLRTMLGRVHSEYLNEWMILLAESGRRLPHDALVEVLDCQSNDGLSVDVLALCLDRRGRWLASQNPRWRKYADSTDDPAEAEAAWATATATERIAALRALRRSAPERARELVASTFQTEPADRRAAIVAEFAAGLSMADEPFLEAALGDRSKDVRVAAADLLKSLPESRLALRMIERSAALLSWKPGMLGIGKGSLEVETPGSCDPSMIRDGVRPKPDYRSKLGERAWLLREVLAATPPSRISERLGVPAPRIIEAAAATEWREALLEGWSVAATRFRDAEWAEALIAAASWTPDAPWERERERGLFAILPAKSRAEVFRGVLRNTPDPLRSYHPAASLVFALGDAMTPAIGREIVDRLRRLVEGERAEFAAPDRATTPRDRSGDRRLDHAAGNIIKGLAGCLPLEMADEIAARFPETEPPHHFYQSACLAMIDGLAFRRDTHREFAP